MTHRLAYPHIAVIATATFLTTSLAGLNARQRSGEAVSISDNDIGGVVRSTKGAEAGVWVIAETNDLPTKFAKIVVTDDRGALRGAPATQGELQNLGARLRPYRFPANSGHA